MGVLFNSIAFKKINKIRALKKSDKNVRKSFKNAGKKLTKTSEKVTKNVGKSESLLKREQQNVEKNNKELHG